MSLAGAKYNKVEKDDLSCIHRDEQREKTELVFKLTRTCGDKLFIFLRTVSFFSNVSIFKLGVSNSSLANFL